MGMARLQLLLLLLGGIALLRGGGGAGSSTHTLHYFKVAISEPSQGMPRFIIVAYLDDQLFAQYDSNTQEILPQVPWVWKVKEEDSSCWEKQIRLTRNWEHFFQENLRSYHNQTKGVQVWQWTHGCQLSQDRSQDGHMEFGYDGRDFLSLDLQRLTWIGGDAGAQRAKRRWDANVKWNQDHRHFVEEVCIAWLQKFLDYAKESLQRREAPTMKVGRKKGYDGRETLICRAHGFYPKEIDVTWLKDGEDRKPDTFTGGVLPNSDGTYHTWLSIEVDSQEKDRYRCRVEHDSLPEPLDLAWEEPASNLGLILAILGGLLAVLLLLGAGVAFYMRKRQNNSYKETARSDQGSDKSTSGRHATTQRSPAELLHGREVRTKLNVSGFPVVRSDLLTEAELRKRVGQRQEKCKVYVDKRRGAKNVKFECGSFVRVRRPGILRKGGRRFTAPLKIVEKKGPYTYKLSGGHVWNASHLVSVNGNRREMGSESDNALLMPVLQNGSAVVCGDNNSGVQLEPSAMQPQIPSSSSLVFETPPAVMVEGRGRIRRPPVWTKDYVMG